MKNRDFKQVTKLIIACTVLSEFVSVQTAAVADCPPQQVLHFNPATNKGICCIPVPLPKGFGFKSCTRNGTHDTTEVCPKKPLQLYQWDDTTTASEATCMAEMQCLDVANKMIEKCEEHGQNCHNECVCNFPGGFCGTEYFSCNPFPVSCPRDNVQEDCSCRSPGLEPEKRNGKSDPDLSNSINPNTSVSKLPSSVSKLPSLSASGKSDKKVDGDQTLDVGIMKEKDNNNDTTSKTEPEEFLSTGSIIGIMFAVIVVIGGLLFAYILWNDRYKRLWGKCKRANQDSVQPKPVQTVKPFYRNSSEDEDEAQSLQRQVIDQDEPAGQELVAQPFQLDTPPQDGVHTNLFEDLQMNSSVDWSTLGSSLYDSHNSMANQQELSLESGRDQTHVKVVIRSENLIEEEVHHIGAVNTPPQDGAQTNLFEDLQLNSSVDLTTLDSSLYNSHSSMANQQEVSVESGRDQTHVKLVISSTNLIEEDHIGAMDNSRLCHVAVEPTLSSQRDQREEKEL